MRPHTTPDAHGRGHGRRGAAMEPLRSCEYHLKGPILDDLAFGEGRTF